MVNITQDDLLRYLYNETSPADTEQIERLLQTDSILQTQFSDLKGGKKRLEKIKLISPDERSLDKIFNYSERAVVTAVEHHD